MTSKHTPGPRKLSHKKWSLGVIWRFMDKVQPDEETGCWLWQGASTPCKGTDPRGAFNIGGEILLAHRVAYEIFCGPIPDGMLVCHKCDVPSCVNPFHLFIGTHSDNTQDAIQKGRLHNGRSYITHCPQGHPYDSENTYTWKGQRHCKTCGRVRSREYAKRRKARAVLEKVKS